MVTEDIVVLEPYKSAIFVKTRVIAFSAKFQDALARCWTVGENKLQKQQI